MKTVVKFGRLGFIIVILIFYFSCKKSSSGSGIPSIPATSLAKASFTYIVDTSKISTVIFSNTSSGAKKYLWLFGSNSETSAEFCPVHEYKYDDQYTVRLVAYDSLGVGDTYIGTVIVKSTKGRVFFYRYQFLSDPCCYPFYYQYGSTNWGQGIGGGTLTNFYAKEFSRPKCSDTNIVKIIQNVGTYDYMAKGQNDAFEWLTWTGKYTVNPAGCTSVVFDYKDGK